MSQNTPATHVLNQSLTTACIDLDSSRTARHGTVWRPSSRDRKPSFMATAFVELVYDHKNKAWNSVKEMIPIDTYCPCCIDTSASSTWHPAADSQCDPCQQSKWYATIATLIYPKTIFPRRMMTNDRGWQNHWAVAHSNYIYIYPYIQAWSWPQLPGPSQGMLGYQLETLPPSRAWPGPHTAESLAFTSLCIMRCGK